MFEIYYPKKDSTIFGYDELVNSGIDEIVELNTRSSIHQNTGQNHEPSRILIDFPKVDGEFSSVVENGSNVFANFGFSVSGRMPSSSSKTKKAFRTFNITMDEAVEDSAFDMPNAFSFFGEKTAPNRNAEEEKEEPEVTESKSSAWLRLWFANGQGLPKKYTIEAFKIDASWKEGRGRSSNIPPTKSPVNWIERNKKSDWNSPGGDYKNVPRSSETFNGDDPDVFMDVNPILSEGLPHGILVKRRDESFDRVTELKFFSSQTQTVYPPQLLVGRDNYEFNNHEDAEPFEKENLTVFVSGLKEKYPATKTRLSVTIREKYEQREFLGVRPTDRVESIKGGKYVPKRSLTYKIKDERTGHTIFPFDERYSAVSFDGKKHYFDINLNNLFPKRDYRILFRYRDPETAKEKIFDNNQTFRVWNETIGTT